MHLASLGLGMQDPPESIINKYRLRLICTSILKVVGNEKGGGGAKKVVNVCNTSQTVAIEVYLKFEHALFEQNSYFLFHNSFDKKQF
jgi:hypothetical protein